MTTTNNAIESGVQQVYTEIRDSLRLILGAELQHELNSDLEDSILNSLDDAISNNWDELMDSFYFGVRGEQLSLFS